MAFIKGYFYSTEAAALEKVAIINNGEGLPNNGHTTQTYCEPMQCIGGFYLPFDEVTEKYLGTPTDIELPQINTPIS